MQAHYKKQNMDELAAEAVGLGRQVANRAKELHLGGNAKDVAFVTRCLLRLKERQSFDEADEGGLFAVKEILERDIASECLGSAEQFEKTGYDEFGPQWEIREMPVYTERGNELIKLQKLFQDFLNRRDGVLDQLASHRCLLKMMSS
jgi:hypothetical protein